MSPMISTSISKLHTIRTCIDKTAISLFMTPPTKFFTQLLHLGPPKSLTQHNHGLNQYLMLKCFLSNDVPRISEIQSSRKQNSIYDSNNTTSTIQFNNESRNQTFVLNQNSTQFTNQVGPYRQSNSNAVIIYTEVEHTQLLCKKYTIPC